MLSWRRRIQPGEVPMTQPTESLLRQAMRLPIAQRAELVDKLLESLHPDGDDATPEAVKAAWVAECGRRMAESDAGTPGIPLEDAWPRIAGKYA